jgi:HPt (histidine-containing phosphotransfer) domain-containing protein
MDGLEAAAVISKLDAEIPIIALTANIMSNDRDTYQSLGMDDCVGKPFTSQELWRCLMRYLNPVGWMKEDAHHRDHADYQLRQKLINNFVKTNRDIMQHITAALNTGDLKRAHRLAHTLKSNAGQLGKTALQQIAEIVESKLTGETDLTTPHQLQILGMELNTVIDELLPMVQSVVNTTTAAEPLDAASILALCVKVESMLKESDPECLSWIDTLRLMPGSEELIDQMEEYDFKSAAKTLIELKRMWTDGP